MRLLVGYFKTHIHTLATLIVKPEKAWAQSGVYFSASYFRTSTFSCHGIWTIYNSAFILTVGVQKSVSYILVFTTGKLFDGVQGKAFFPSIMKVIKIRVGKLRRSNRNIETVRWTQIRDSATLQLTASRTPVWSLKFKLCCLEWSYERTVDTVRGR
jgi:hypothetical protein